MSRNVQFGNLTVEISEGRDVVTYTFTGDVDENFRQEDLPRQGAAVIQFELGGVETFNSCGIREWIYLIKDFSKLGKLIFKNCSVAMIDQINMVPDSVGSAEVDSFYAPYFCQSDSCNTGYNRLINVKDCMADLLNRTAPEFKCDECGEVLDFDALEESYFQFVRDGGQFKKSS
jgi:hypothetical protein